LGSILLAAGVEDMPDEGIRWDPDRPNPRNLPAGYLSQEAGKLFNLALKVVGNPTEAQDVMQDVLLKLYTDNKIKKVTLTQALSYLSSMVIWKAKHNVQKLRHQPRLLVDPKDTPKDTQEDIVFLNNPYVLDDPKEYRKIEELFGGGRWDREVVPELVRIHPDMPLFFERILEDPSQNIKAVVKGLPHFSGAYVSWLRFLRQKVGPKLKELASETRARRALA
jgi:hypothetical protein